MRTMMQVLGDVVSDLDVDLDGGGPNRPREKEEKQDVVGSNHAFASCLFERLAAGVDPVSHQWERCHTYNHPGLFRDGDGEVVVVADSVDGLRRSPRPDYVAWTQGLRH